MAFGAQRENILVRLLSFERRRMCNYLTCCIVTNKIYTSQEHKAGLFPYDEDDDVEQEVRDSVEQSFRNLEVDHIGVLLLHPPFRDATHTLQAWKTME